ncbi:hypothetical protein XYCOK13_43020 [Xylanibacillus composti]|uniref:Uncharacterized protein n=1 Tax=Xylanibacillus composti TaxID=1572762 RepID=A0A8J4H9L5_9BACL|nr:hypothetical protein XYCOK13_43020 [Xylanibacillus composti]
MDKHPQLNPYNKKAEYNYYKTKVKKKDGWPLKTMEKHDEDTRGFWVLSR